MKLALALVVLVGCGDGQDVAGCTGKVDIAMSSAPGTVVAMGNFGEGQPIMEVVSPNGDHRDYPATDYDGTMATFTNIPSGAQQVNWILSCFDAEGQAVINGPASVTVQ